jgi:DNA-binding NarL/FixJ family response regulator
MTIRVIIADDHPIVRSGIRGELARHADFTVVAEALDGDAALRLVQELEPNVLMLDVNMPGLRALKVLLEVKRLPATCRVLVLTAYSDTVTVLGMLKAGADGYLLKDDDPTMIPEAVRAVASGKTWLSPAVAEIARVAPGESLPPEDNYCLTRRERQVLRLLNRGCTNKEISQEMQTTERTVEFHIFNLKQKLGVNSRLEAALWAKENG